MMRRFIGWLADFYPNTVFWSDRFMPDLVLKLNNKPHSSKGSTLMIGVCVAASRLMKKPGDVFESTFTGVTSKGRKVGDFRITVERLK